MLARLGHVSRARIRQIVSMLRLAPDIQEAILFLGRPEQGRGPVDLRQVLPIAMVLDCSRQRRLCRKLCPRTQAKQDRHAVDWRVVNSKRSARGPDRSLASRAISAKWIASTPTY
jgi:hypothetical protein